MVRLVLVFILWCVVTPCFAATTITLPVYNDNAAELTQYVVYNAVPIKYENSTSTIDDLKVTSDEAGLTEVDAQFEIISRYDDDENGHDSSDNIRTVMVVFEATVSASSYANYYLQVNPGSGTGGNVSGTNLISNETGYHQIATGNLTARITESAGFNIFDLVTVDSTNVVSSPSADGIELVYSGTTYSSYNSNDAPTLEIIYNGPLFAVLKVSAHLEDSSNNTLIPSGSNPSAVNPIAFDIFYTVVKDSRTVDIDFRLKNENPGGAGYSATTNRNQDITSLALKTTLGGLGTVTEVDFDDWSDTTSPSSDYYIYQEHCLPGSCAQASESDAEGTPNFNYYIKESTTTRYTGRRFDSYSQIRDADRGLMIAAEYHWQNWPFDINLDATNKEAVVYLLPDEASDHTFIGGRWKTWKLTYNFHADVAEGYTFASELARIKKPLKILLGDQIADSNFYADLTPSADPTITATGGGSESIDEAYNDWKDSILSWYDATTYSDDTSVYKYDLTDIRELRPVSSTTGVYNGPIDMYGWDVWGDFARGASTWGMNALQYGHNYSFILNGHKFKKYGMVQIGEQMTLATGDNLVIHAPIDDSTVISGSGRTVKTTHGMHRGEAAAATKIYSYTTSWQTSNAWKHGFPHGQMIEYALTGKPWIKDALDDQGDMLRYYYGGINPDHGNYTADLGSSFDCVTSTCTWWRQNEARVWCRSMGMAVGLYQTTGDIDYYNIAKGIFTNVLLELEYNNDGLIWNGSGGIYPWYTMQPMKYTIMLYYLAGEVGDTTLQSSVSAYLQRLSTFFYRIMSEDLNNVPGTYDSGNYYAYLIYYQWDESTGFSGAAHPEYINELADLFAFTYQMTSNETWLTRARDAFKDQWFYDQTDAAETENTTVSGSYATNGPGGGDAWMKQGKNLIRPMYYLKVEAGELSESSNTRATIGAGQTVTLGSGTTVNIQ